MKKSSGTLYWGQASNEPLAESDLSGTISKEFIFFGGKRIARLDLPGGAVHYYFSDHLGSSNVVTNSTGTTIEEESDFYPFGGERAVTDLLPDQRYRFTGRVAHSSGEQEAQVVTNPEGAPFIRALFHE